MRYWIGFGIILLAGVSSASARDPAAFDWDAWRYLPVLDGGRYKPFDTLAWESARLLGNRTTVADPENGEMLNCVAFYLSMIFQWEGRSETLSRQMLTPKIYFNIHEPDKWDRAALLRVDNMQLRDAIGLAKNEKYVSPLELSKATFRDPQTGRESSFLAQAQKLTAHKQARMSTIDQKTLELAEAYWTYLELRMGEGLNIIPVPGAPHDEWISAGRLMHSKFDDSSDPTGLIRKAQEQFLQAMAAFRSNAPGDFQTASKAFFAYARELGTRAGTYPSQSVIALEVNYNRWAPFRFAWIFSSMALILSLLAAALGWRICYCTALIAFVASLSAILAGFTMRIIISGRAPVTNMYESVVYLGLGTAIFGLIFELISRRRYILTAAAAISTVALVIADNCPAVLDPSLRPLQPVLRNNFWLVLHVMSITLSYAAFALALGIGDITLGYYLFRSKNRETISALTKFTYRVLQVGVLLLAIGTILGAVWAEYAWGRFWGWDPKEVWALITLLGYVALLHARHVRWVGSLGLAAASVVCFTLVMMAWYGVNYLLGAGLHSYGFGGGGQEYVFGAIFIQFLYVAAAVFKASLDTAIDKQELTPHTTSAEKTKSCEEAFTPPLQV